MICSRRDDLLSPLRQRGVHRPPPNSTEIIAEVAFSRLRGALLDIPAVSGVSWVSQSHPRVLPDVLEVSGDS